MGRKRISPSLYSAKAPGWSSGCRAAAALKRSLPGEHAADQRYVHTDTQTFRSAYLLDSDIDSNMGRAGGSVPNRSLGHDLGPHAGPVGTLRRIIGGHRDGQRQRHRGSRGGGAAGVLVLAVPSMEDPECRGAETPNARESVSKERAAEQARGAYDMNRAARWLDGTAWHRRRSIA